MATKTPTLKEKSQIKNPAEVKFKSIENKLVLLHNGRDFEAMAAVAPLKLFNPKIWQ